MFEKFDVLFSEAYRRHYIVLYVEWDRYVLQEYDVIKRLFIDVRQMKQYELEQNHFHKYSPTNTK